MTTATSPPIDRKDRLFTYPTSELLDLRRKMFGLVDDLQKDGHSDTAEAALRSVADIDRDIQRRRDAGEYVPDYLQHELPVSA